MKRDWSWSGFEKELEQELHILCNQTVTLIAMERYKQYLSNHGFTSPFEAETYFKIQYPRACKNSCELDTNGKTNSYLIEDLLSIAQQILVKRWNYCALLM